MVWNNISLPGFVWSGFPLLEICHLSTICLHTSDKTWKVTLLPGERFNFGGQRENIAPNICALVIIWNISGSPRTSRMYSSISTLDSLTLANARILVKSKSWIIFKILLDIIKTLFSCSRSHVSSSSPEFIEHILFCFPIEFHSFLIFHM